ncbi:MAG: hypothetical protein SX243_13285 [Acidobacteriota bacterium]|nr:hypothetical protein [Acidobacteriota bacterium]
MSTFLAGVDPDYDLREELGLYFKSQGLGLGRVSSKVQQYLGPAGTCQGAIEVLHCGIADAWPEVELLEYTTVEVTALLLGGVEASAAVSSSGLSTMAARSSRSLASGASRRAATGNFAHHGLEFLDDGVRMVPNAGRQVVPRATAGVAPRVANAANHVFGPKSLAKHKLGGVLDAFKGDSVAAFNALEGAAQQLANQGAIKGVFQTTVEVAGQTVTLRGAVVEGVVKVGTAFIP